MTDTIELTKKTGEILNLDPSIVETARLSAADLEATFSAASKNKKFLDACTSALITSICGMVLTLAIFAPQAFSEKSHPVMEKTGETAAEVLTPLFFLSMIAGMFPAKRETEMQEWLKERSNQNLLADYKADHPAP